MVRWIGILRHFSTMFGGQFPQLENNWFLGVNQQPSASSLQLPPMGFEPQLRGAKSFKARRINHSATEAHSALGSHNWLDRWLWLGGVSQGGHFESRYWPKKCTNFIITVSVGKMLDIKWFQLLLLDVPGLEIKY